MLYRDIIQLCDDAVGHLIWAYVVCQKAAIEGKSGKNAMQEKKKIQNQVFLPDVILGAMWQNQMKCGIC